MIMTPTHAYVSVAGTGMNFNITLLPCSDTNCTTERQTAYENNAAILGIDISGGNTFTPSADPEHNVSVFIGIGVGMVLTGLCTLGVVAGARKFR